MKNSILQSLITTTALLLMGTPALAGEAEEQIVAKVVEAYGLEDLKSITITSDIRSSQVGQGYIPGYVDLSPVRSITQFDLETDKASTEVWRYSNDDSQRFFVSGDEIKAINYNSKTFTVDEDATFYSQFGGIIRLSDTLLAHELLKQSKSAKHTGEMVLWGGAHDILTVEMPMSPLLTLYINRGTGMISKMTRMAGTEVLTYQFSSFDTQGGVAYAREYDIYVDGVHVRTTKRRSIRVNNVTPSAFRLDKGIKPAGERMDMSEMTVEGIGEMAHHVGQTNTYSTFVEADDYIIAIGAYGGLKDRFEAYQAAHDSPAKPLKYVVVTHHHLDHIDGVPDAVELGASFIAPKMAVSEIVKRSGGEIAAEDIKTVDGKLTLGPIEVHTIATRHVAEFALAYIPDAKAIFDADHYGAQMVDGPSPASLFSLGFKSEIERLGLDVDYILTSHGRKMERWEDFTAATAKLDGELCQSNRPICR